MDFTKLDVQCKDLVSFTGGFLCGKYEHMGWPESYIPPDTTEVIREAYRKGYDYGKAVATGKVARPDWDDAENDELCRLVVANELTSDQLVGRMVKKAIEADKIPEALAGVPKEVILGHAERMISGENRRELRMQAFAPDRDRGLLGGAAIALDNPFENFEEDTIDAVAFIGGFIAGYIAKEIHRAPPGAITEAQCRTEDVLFKGYEAGAVARMTGKPPKWWSAGLEMISTLFKLGALSLPHVRDMLHQMWKDAKKRTPHDCAAHRGVWGDDEENAGLPALPPGKKEYKN